MSDEEKQLIKIMIYVAAILLILAVIIQRCDYSYPSTSVRGSS